MQKKYIVIENLGEQIIVFSAALEHKTVAGDHKVVSAGFINIEPLEITSKAFCYGESMTLGISSRPERDSILANVLLFA